MRDTIENGTENNGAGVLLELKDLRTYFHLAEGVVRAVDGVNLTIKRGRTLGVVGDVRPLIDHARHRLVRYACCGRDVADGWLFRLTCFHSAPSAPCDRSRIIIPPKPYDVDVAIPTSHGDLGSWPRGGSHRLRDAAWVAVAQEPGSAI